MAKKSLRRKIKTPGKNKVIQIRDDEITRTSAGADEASFLIVGEDSDNQAVKPFLIIGNAKQGRPTKYYTHVEPRLKEVEQWVKDGCTDYSIAESLQISHESLIGYKKDYLSLIETYKKAQAEDIAIVVSSLRKRANGYEAIETESGGRNGDIVKTKHIPGDTTAQQVYLYNKDPDNWKAKRDDNSTGLSQTININEVTINIQQIATEIQTLERLRLLRESGNIVNN